MKLRKKSNLTSVSKVKPIVSSLLDSKIDKRRKLMVIGIILYILSPIDILPDVLPMLGYADDILLPVLLFVAEHLLTNHDVAKETETKNQLGA
ncbi:YkvA family protein [Jeotgalibaca caeni]|uniref:YkvA family protein n=1 Tax=Jeotgalibaca caeni TaxID=3028623 RepID=UPI00237D626C|nr:DUF1232 domain-containing protein [Jeotgalibaca caeni]MDE1549799.1 DUF1232 domain-containing protein [Jeotgalibaca caeni]